MDIEDVSTLAIALDKVRPDVYHGRLQRSLYGRLIARQLDDR